jgi:hypothetical protein
VIAAGIGFHNTRIDPFALDEPRIQESAVAIDRECRMMGYLVVEGEATEPSIGEVKLDLLAQLALETDAVY